MKAFLMAAGQGTRLRPFTDRRPKCLIPIHGKPLLGIWLDLLARHGITEVLINTHHHAGQVERYVAAARSGTPLALHTVHEPRLRGSAGTLWDNRDFVADDTDFIIAYADNLTDLNLVKMIDFHHRFRSMGGVLTMGLMRAPNPSACGIVTMDEHKRIIRFVEKPAHPQSDLANGGVYVASKDLYPYLADIAAENRPVMDLGHHLLPRLEGKMFGFQIAPSYLKDIGTPEAYREALAQWPNPRHSI